MYLFAGDRIRVKDRGHLATVKAASFNSIHQEWEYYVIWDGFPEKGECCYMASDADKLWEKIDEIADAQINHLLPHGFGLGKSYVNQDPDLYHAGIIPNKECDHKWVEVGFNHTKTVCYHCDKEKQ
ncbi:MAG: hypothetical protein HC840_00575 [Leptolyngbyaceae cyanobacterium RM2_2_4]|nr:hypothetical protein [Leptolyngbyaceae cyanobacterium RM2_2_4]